MMANGNDTCKDHSGCLRDIKHLQNENIDQWKAINGLRNWLIATLTTSTFSLLGIIVMLMTKK